MPLYEYACNACDARFERIQKFSDPLVTVCPTCGGDVRKLISSPAIQFKGAGWYVNDYAKPGAKSDKSESAKAESKSADSKADGAKSSESKGEGSGSGKSEGTSSSETSSNSKSDSSTQSSDSGSRSAPAKPAAK
jgi:putative FmdB family regulatory protein